MNNPEQQAREIADKTITRKYADGYANELCYRAALEALHLKQQEIDKLEARVNELEEAISQWAEQRTTGSEFIMLEAIANNEDRA